MEKPSNMIKKKEDNTSIIKKEDQKDSWSSEKIPIFISNGTDPVLNYSAIITYHNEGGISIKTFT